MKQFFSLFISILCFLGNPSAANSYTIVPYPNYLIEHTGEFHLNKQTKIILPDNSSEDIHMVANQFAAQLKKVSGIDLPVVSGSKNENDGQSIVFRFDENIAKEGYNLIVEQQNILIEASQGAGFFYAIQTIKQLLPVAIYENNEISAEWTIPCVEIKDVPRFGYRGMHLDVARHFFDVEEVKKYIDILSVHKVNTLHWHLTDDQGWRIEIKKYPKLTTIGSQRTGTVIKKEWGNYDNIPYGGYYTQDEIREIVDYASRHFITIIPEIDMPGHMVAALASYPHLGCIGKDYEVFRDWGVSEEVLCIGKESTFTFLEDILTEVMELFPSKYIHIGGDECPKTRWKKCPHCQQRIKELGLKTDEKYTAEHYLQSYAISRVEKFLNNHGRQIIGWDEILEGGVAPNATIMSWRGIDGGIDAARQYHDVIMTPNSHLYFDYYQSLDTDNEPFGFGGYVSVERVYSFDPIPKELNKEEQKHIIGVQANLWTEYIKSNEHLEYMLLPRLAALSEVQWINEGQRDWKRFLNNMEHISGIYDTMGYNYAKHIFGVTGHYSINPDEKGILITLETLGNAPIYYSIDEGQRILYKEPVHIANSCTFNAQVKRDNMLTQPLVKTFTFNKATGCRIEMNTQPKDKFSFAGASILVDGLRGNTDFGTGFWLGYESEPLDVIITFPDMTEISSVKAGSLLQIGAWIFPPVNMEVYVSENGQDFISVGKEEFPKIEEKDKDLIKIKEYECPFDKTFAKKIRVIINPLNTIPDWHGGKGKKAFLFIDELIVE